MSEAFHERELRQAQHYLRLGLVQPAADRLKRVLALEPDDATAHALLSLCLVELKRPAAALHEAQLASTLEPDSALSHSALGAALLAQRDFHRSEQHFRHALAIEPEEVHHHLQLAHLYGLTDRRKQRAEILARALELAPSDPDVLSASGQLALDLGDAQTAQQRAEQALRVAPQSLGAIVLMGFVRLRQGEVAAAREHALWALRERADDVRALQLLAAVKARENLWLGLWWQLNVWLTERGPPRMIVILICAYIAFRVLRQLLEDFGKAGLADLLTYAWFGLCAYTWIGPALFARMLQKELKQVRLRENF